MLMDGKDVTSLASNLVVEDVSDSSVAALESAYVDELVFVHERRQVPSASACAPLLSCPVATVTQASQVTVDRMTAVLSRTSRERLPTSSTAHRPRSTRSCSPSARSVFRTWGRTMDTSSTLEYSDGNIEYVAADNVTSSSSNFAIASPDCDGKRRRSRCRAFQGVRRSVCGDGVQCHDRVGDRELQSVRSVDAVEAESRRSAAPIERDDRRGRVSARARKRHRQSRGRIRIPSSSDSSSR